MRSLFVCLSFAIAVVSARTAWPLPTAQPADYVPFEIKTSLPQGTTEGDLTTVVFHITNMDSQPHVLYDLARDRFPWTVYTFQRSFEGALEVDEELGAYRYDPGKPGLTLDFFSEGLVWPGQTISLKVTYRPLESRESFTVRWFQFCSCSIDRLFWMPERLSRAMGEPVPEHDPGSAALYVHTNAPARQRFEETEERELVPAARPSAFAVIFPVERLGDVAFKSGMIKVHYDVAARKPGLATTLRQMTTQPEKATFSSAFNSWVLCYPSHCVLVKPGGSLENAPTSSPDFFDDLDHRGEVVVQIESEDKELARIFPTQMGDGVRTVGRFIAVPTARIGELFSYVIQKGLRIDLEPAGLGSHYFILAGER